MLKLADIFCCAHINLKPPYYKILLNLYPKTVSFKYKLQISSFFWGGGLNFDGSEIVLTNGLRNDDKLTTLAYSYK